MPTVPVTFPGVSVVRVQRNSAVVVPVKAKSPTVVSVSGSGASDNSTFARYANWLAVDGGNPFSHFRDEDVLDGGKPSDY